MYSNVFMGFTGGAVVKNLSSNARDARDTALIHELGRSPGEGNPLEEVLANLWTVARQASLSMEDQENPWTAETGELYIVHEVTEELDTTEHTHIYTHTQCVYVNPSLPIYPSRPLSLGNNRFVFYICNSTFS